MNETKKRLSLGFSQSFPKFTKYTVNFSKERPSKADREKVLQFFKNSGQMQYHDPLQAFESLSRNLELSQIVVERSIKSYVGKNGLLIIVSMEPFILKLRDNKKENKKKKKNRPADCKGPDHFGSPRTPSYPVNPHVSSKH